MKISKRTTPAEYVSRYASLLGGRFLVRTGRVAIPEPAERDPQWWPEYVPPSPAPSGRELAEERYALAVLAYPSAASLARWPSVPAVSARSVRPPSAVREFLAALYL